MNLKIAVQHLQDCKCVAKKIQANEFYTNSQQSDERKMNAAELNFKSNEWAAIFHQPVK